MSVEQAEEAARKLAASIEQAIGRITCVRKLPAEKSVQKIEVNRNPEQPGS